MSVLRAARAAIAATVAAVAVLASAACGGGEPAALPEPPPGVDQVIDVDMLDVRFDPRELTVSAGTTVAFRFRNSGRLAHEAAFGDDALQEGLRRGAQPPTERVLLSRGRTGMVVYTFDRSGSLVIGCHVAGHWDAGMKITVTVA